MIETMEGLTANTHLLVDRKEFAPVKTYPTRLAFNPFMMFPRSRSPLMRMLPLILMAGITATLINKTKMDKLARQYPALKNLQMALSLGKIRWKRCAIYSSVCLSAHRISLHDFKEKTMTTRGPNMTQYLGLATVAASGIIAYNYLKPKHMNRDEPNQNLLKPSSHSIDKTSPALAVDRAARE
ncbi:unnamed protein product, partial [Mesorhabditis belari]|uniref:Uncharacterized protein n=1 Tax=Mesorhabditis belari TaxID=2138241 RepID=A0AAF3ERH8_9BILA